MEKDILFFFNKQICFKGEQIAPVVAVPPCVCQRKRKFVTYTIKHREYAGNCQSGAKTGMLLCRFPVGRVNDETERGIEGILVEGMLFLAL